MSHAWRRIGAVSAAGTLIIAALPVAATGSATAAASLPQTGSGPWVEENLRAADRVNARVDADGLAIVAPERAPMSASLADSTVRVPSALATFPAHELPHAAETVEVEVATTGDPADLVVEARGGRTDGVWTEWRAAETARSGADAGGGRIDLPAPVERVQIRVGMGPGAGRVDDRVTVVRHRVGEDPEDTEGSEDPEKGEGAGDAVAEEPEAGADPDATDPRDDTDAPEDAEEPAEEPDPAADAAPEYQDPFSARLFATRIGLVGNRTANGHIVRDRDYFVALPSRRGLAPRGTGDYTVRVCTEDRRRCAYLPVWDVGPWNIRDDHWNTGREMWLDLTRGKPQAQAAFQEGHNAGVDGFGRRVANPAGIDLADGAFWDGLRLSTNAWVHVDYLWTGDHRHVARVRTASERDPVIVRSGTGLDRPAVGVAAHAAQVDVECHRTGDRVAGPEGESRRWLRIGEDHYLPAAFVTVADAAEVPPCAAGDE